MANMNEVTSVRIDNCARGEGTSGMAAVLRADDGRLQVGYFTDNDVIVLVFPGRFDIVDIDPVSSSVGAMCVGTAYDVGLQLKDGDKESVYFYDENGSCVGSVDGDEVEPDDCYMWDLTDELPDEIDKKIIKELGLGVLDDDE